LQLPLPWIGDHRPNYRPSTPGVGGHGGGRGTAPLPGLTDPS